MSIKVMSKVWEGYPGDSYQELLMLLALADWSDDEGRCYPSIAAIGRKCRVQARQARRHVHSLIDLGLVSVTENTNGGKPGTTRRYRINIDRLTGVIKDTATVYDTATVEGIRRLPWKVANTSLNHQYTSLLCRASPTNQFQSRKKQNPLMLKSCRYSIT